MAAVGGSCSLCICMVFGAVLAARLLADALSGTALDGRPRVSLWIDCYTCVLPCFLEAGKASRLSHARMAHQGPPPHAERIAQAPPTRRDLNILSTLSSSAAAAAALLPRRLPPARPRSAPSSRTGLEAAGRRREAQRHHDSGAAAGRRRCGAWPAGPARRGHRHPTARRHRATRREGVGLLPQHGLAQVPRSPHGGPGAPHAGAAPVGGTAQRGLHHRSCVVLPVRSPSCLSGACAASTAPRAPTRP